MLYYTIYVKNLNNGTGYIDVALEDDQLLLDYQHYLDVGLASHKLYPLASLGPGSERGLFVINMAEVAAITTAPPQKAGGGKAAPSRKGA